AAGRGGAVLDRVLEVEEEPGLRAGVALVDQDGAAAQQVAVPFQGEVERRVEERMAWTDECGGGLPRRRDELLLEDDALVALEDRLADADHAVAVADHRRDVPNLVTPRFALPDGAAEALERFQEERFDVVGL